jgi:hypothetical protein
MIDTVQLLREDPHGTEDYKRELGDLSRTAKDLQGLHAPTDSIHCDAMAPPTCDPR